MLPQPEAPVAPVDVALAHARRLLATQPALAAQQADEILRVVPDHPLALLLLGTARCACGDPAAGLAPLERLCALEPDSAAAHCELGRALGEAGRGDAAVAALRRALVLQPDLGEALRLLADHLAAIGDFAAADATRAQHIRCSTRDPRLLSAAAALCDNRIAEAEALLRRHLLAAPTDVAAIRMFAEVAARLGRFRDAENLLARCLELAPGFHAARQNYALVLYRQGRATDALPHIDQLLALEPRNPNYRSLKAAVLTGVGEYVRAIQIYDGILSEYPQQAKIWLSYGHALKTAGRREQGIDAYRRTIELDPHCGEAYWSLANLKTFRFTAEEVGEMRAELGRPELSAEQRYHFHFALGKALEDQGEFPDSFEEYRRGNALRRAELHYDARANRAHLERSRAVFTPAFFAARAGVGAEAPDPIFIVGLPRAGSTLLEQILASHSRVEGTMELPDIASIARTLGGSKQRGEAARYPEALESLEPGHFRAFGEEYLARTRVQRKRGAPFFIDKMPNNFVHVGLIHLMLPNARIIDARRHPLGCCLSGFKQHFARGQSFTYDLEELGAYYRDYVELMAHFDGVLPGRVHRVFHEELVTDTEAVVRRALEYCGLEFEPSCLEFHQNARAVRTASSEQVRTPIYREGVDHWRHYEPWLEPLKRALGPVLDAYPHVPDFSRPSS
jgi:tetratricopeptide (TPR) repeat protein